MTIWHAPLPDLAHLDALEADSMPAHLGIRFTGSGPGWLSARMPINERTIQPWGRLHGGASVALAETIASVGAMLTVDPDTSAAVGLEINANHVNPASDDFVEVVARAEHLGRTTQIWSFRITNMTENLV